MKYIPKEISYVTHPIIVSPLATRRQVSIQPPSVLRNRPQLLSGQKLQSRPQWQMGLNSRRKGSLKQFNGQMICQLLTDHAIQYIKSDYIWALSVKYVW